MKRLSPGRLDEVVARRRVAGAPISQVALRIVGAGHIDRAAAGLPGVVLVLPGLAARLAGGGDHEGLPLLLAGLGIEPGEPVAHAVVAAGGADHDRVLERERRGRELEIRLIAMLLVPDDLAGLCIGRDDAPVIAGDGDHEIAPERDAAVAVGLLLAGVHLPQHLALLPGVHVDLVDHAPDVGDVHEAVVDQRRRLDVLVAGLAAERHCKGELEVLHVRLVDLVRAARSAASRSRGGS